MQTNKMDGRARAQEQSKTIWPSPGLSTVADRPFIFAPHYYYAAMMMPT
jgi:hypothetical protein